MDVGGVRAGLQPVGGHCHREGVLCRVEGERGLAGGMASDRTAGGGGDGVEGEPSSRVRVRGSRPDSAIGSAASEPGADPALTLPSSTTRRLSGGSPVTWPRAVSVAWAWPGSRRLGA